MRSHAPHRPIGHARNAPLDIKYVSKKNPHVLRSKLLINAVIERSECDQEEMKEKTKIERKKNRNTRKRIE